MPETSAESIAALSEHFWRLEAAIEQLDERLIVANAMMQAALVAIGKQRKVDQPKLAEDFAAAVYTILGLTGKRDLFNKRNYRLY